LNLKNENTTQVIKKLKLNAKTGSHRFGDLKRKCRLLYTKLSTMPSPFCHIYLGSTKQQIKEKKKKKKATFKGKKRKADETIATNQRHALLNSKVPLKASRVEEERERMRE